MLKKILGLYLICHYFFSLNFNYEKQPLHHSVMPIKKCLIMEHKCISETAAMMTMYDESELLGGGFWQPVLRNKRFAMESI